MRKTWETKNLNERPAGRVFLALSLAASLAAFGCTTNRTPGNGEPVGVVRPGVGPAPPSSGVTGSSSGTAPTNPPMFSSSTYIEALPSVNARVSRLPLSPDEAAAVMADNELARGVRVLGPASPGPERGDTGGLTIATGQFQNPAMQLNPILTVNSSVNSAAHLPAIAADSGAVGAVGGTAGFTAGVTSNSVITGGTTTTTAGTVGTTAATTGATPGGASASSAVPTPTTAAVPFTPGNFAAGPGSTAGVGAAGVATTITNNNNGTLTPTVSSSANPTPTVTVSRTAPLNNGGAATVNGTGTAAANGNGTATRTGTLRTPRNTTVTRTSTAAGTASGTVAPIRVSTDANGKVTITNSATSGRQQK